MGRGARPVRGRCSQLGSELPPRLTHRSFILRAPDMTRCENTVLCCSKRFGNYRSTLALSLNKGKKCFLVFFLTNENNMYSL